MKTLIKNSMMREYSLTEALLCIVTGLFCVTTLGLPKLTVGTIVVLSVLCIGIAVTIYMNYPLFEDFFPETKGQDIYKSEDPELKRKVKLYHKYCERQENDAAFFNTLALISLITTVIIKGNMFTSIGAVIALIGFYQLLIAFYSEPYQGRFTKPLATTFIGIAVATLSICLK